MMRARCGAWNEDLLVFDLWPNTPNHRGPAIRPLDAGHLAIIEFDDQGRLFDRSVLAELAGKLEELAKRGRPIILVFVHGWKHNAAEGDSNLECFTAQVIATAKAEDDRPVLGVFLAWRGLSRGGNYFWCQSSFWDRHDAAQRIASGAPREVLGRLKAFRNAGKEGQPAATLVIVGHSFGGLLVYAALSQSLIEAAAAPADQVTPSFGDLVVLVNPAFAAVSYLPIHDIVAERTKQSRFTQQLPVFVSVTASNDFATRVLYPPGTWSRRITEDWRGPHEHDALTHTMGQLPWMRTHALTLACGSAPEENPSQKLQVLTTEDEEKTFGVVCVTPIPCAPSGPSWVASATKDIVDDHNGIWKPEFTGFLRELVAAHLDAA